jgi:hypothetical protein
VSILYQSRRWFIWTSLAVYFWGQAVFFGAMRLGIIKYPCMAPLSQQGKANLHLLGSGFADVFIGLFYLIAMVFSSALLLELAQLHQHGRKWRADFLSEAKKSPVIVVCSLLWALYLLVHREVWSSLSLLAVGIWIWAVAPFTWAAH